MRRDLLPLLQCPQSSAPLTLHVFQEDSQGQVEEGLLLAEGKGHWYPIHQGIPDLVRDPLREEERDAAFLAFHAAYWPAEVTRELPRVPRTEEDQRILAEGIHWGAFMRRFWDVGDRAIFDVRCRGSHPPYYVAGVLERDDRDATRHYGVWPDHLSRAVFPWLGNFRGKWGVDVGCGGGQYGLEAARQGVLMCGTDPSWECLHLARTHAREQGVAIDYIRAEPSHPPFLPGCLDLLLAKDSLHHVPELESVFPSLVALLKDGGEFGCFEHIGRGRVKAALLRRLAPPLIERIRRRWPTAEVPPELLQDSANEDVSMHLVRPVVLRHFEPIEELGEIFLYFEIEQLVHFAFGKRPWLTGAARRGTYALEQALKPFQPVEHWAFHGRKR